MSEKNKTELKEIFRKRKFLLESSCHHLIDSFANKKTLGVADPSASGVEADILTIGIDTSNNVWIKIGENDTNWVKLSVGDNSFYSNSFDELDLSSGLITFTHNFGNQFNIVQVYDENNQLIIPDEITSTDENNTQIDLSSFSPLSGTWNIIIK